MTEAFAVMIVALCAVVGCAISILNLAVALQIRRQMRERSLMYAGLRTRISTVERFLVKLKRAAIAKASLASSLKSPEDGSRG